MGRAQTFFSLIHTSALSEVRLLCLLLLSRSKDIVYNYKTDKYLFLIKAAYQFLPRC